MDEIYAEKVFELTKYVKSKLFNVSFEGNKEDDSEKWIFSEKDWNSVLEEQFKDLVEDIDVEQTERYLKIDEIEVVCKESDSIIIFGQKVSISIIVLLRECIDEIVVGAHYALAYWAGIGAQLYK